MNFQELHNKKLIYELSIPRLLLSPWFKIDNSAVLLSSALIIISDIAC